MQYIPMSLTLLPFCCTKFSTDKNLFEMGNLQYSNTVGICKMSLNVKATKILGGISRLDVIYGKAEYIITTIGLGFLAPASPVSRPVYLDDL